MHSIDVIDTHTAGEPTRVVMAGLPVMQGLGMREIRDDFAANHDHWRRAIVCEPRGSDTMVGALVLPPLEPTSCAGVIFFNNVGYLDMCGHGMIGVVRALAESGQISTGRHCLETPVGLVDVYLHADGRISHHNVESFRLAAEVTIDVPGHGRVRGDVAWGGNWFFMTRDTPVALHTGHCKALLEYTGNIRRALSEQGVCGANGARIDHIEVSTPSPVPGVDSRNFVLCPGMAWDRSPCGTGTSARLACLAAESKLLAGQIWRQESILGSVFEASYQPAARGVLPRITGTAHVTAHSRLKIDGNDPFAWGLPA